MSTLSRLHYSASTDHFSFACGAACSQAIAEWELFADLMVEPLFYKLMREEPAIMRKLWVNAVALMDENLGKHTASIDDDDI